MVPGTLPLGAGTLVLIGAGTVELTKMGVVTGPLGTGTPVVGTGTTGAEDATGAEDGTGTVTTGMVVSIW